MNTLKTSKKKTVKKAKKPKRKSKHDHYQNIVKTCLEEVSDLSDLCVHESAAMIIYSLFNFLVLEHGKKKGAQILKELREEVIKGK